MTGVQTCALPIYYDIKVDGAIASIPADVLLNRCAQTGDALSCAAVVRSGSGFVSSINGVLLNTNGIRIAEDEAFCDALADLRPGFEVYLQFDGFDDASDRRLRGRPMAQARKAAVANLAKYGVPVTLVSTVERGVNDGQVGRVVEFGLASPNVRGVNFQPVELRTEFLNAVDHLK